ncbi:type II toxin-antitoxin system VapC family toxin [soil metagenome]
MILYLDASAAAKLLVEEPESPALAAHLDALDDDSTIVSSALLETELRRLAVREQLGQSVVTGVLARGDLVEPSRSMFYEAGLLPGRTLRTLDALHLVTALRLNAEPLVAYDARLLTAAGEVGLGAISPG